MSDGLKPWRSKLMLVSEADSLEGWLKSEDWIAVRRAEAWNGKRELLICFLVCFLFCADVPCLTCLMH